MTRLALAAIFLPVLAAPAVAAPAPEEIAALIAGKLACAERDSGDGWVLTSETDHNGKRASRLVATIDRKARRSLSLTKSWKTDAPGEWKFSAAALIDGVSYACSATNADTCEWEEVPTPEDPVRVQEDITGHYVTFRDFLLPDHAGAALSLETSQPDAEGAAMKLVVTPKDGIPLVMQAAADGTMVEIDTLFPDGSAYRTVYADRQQFETCLTAATMTRTTTPKDTGYRKTTVISIEARATMTPADTSIDTPARMP